MVSVAGMTDVIKNKNNIIPMVGITIGILATEMAITAIFSPTLLGLLSAGAIAGMGFTPALLGVIAAFSLAFVFTSIQQIITNRAIKSARGKDGTNGKDGKRGEKGVDGRDGMHLSTAIARYMFRNRDKFGIVMGKISGDGDTLQLTLSDADYNTLTKDQNQGDALSVFITLHNAQENTEKEVEVKLKHEVSLPNESVKADIIVVNNKTDIESMKAELDLAKSSNKVAVCNQHLESLIDVDMVRTAMKDPTINAFMHNVVAK